MLNANHLILTLCLSVLMAQNCAAPNSINKSPIILEDTIEGIDVQSYHVSLIPNMEKGTLKGHQTTHFRKVDPLTDAVRFNGRGISITSAQLSGEIIEITRLGSEFVVPLPEEAKPEDSLKLEIHYEAHPQRGYSSNETVVFTTYFACDWMICRQNAFGDKSEITLEITLPRVMETLGPGQVIRAQIQPDGGYQVTWRESTPYSPYLFSFAAGDFSVLEQVINGTTLRFVSPIADRVELEMLFKPTADMLMFFERKAGMAMPQSVYSQLYVEGRYAQEAVSHSIIGAPFLKPILETPQEDWVIAHELAHQWWGNAITCKNLSHFWLNEGLTVFMVAAWKEVRWGRKAYDKEMSLAKRRYTYAKEEGFDVPLSFEGAYPNGRVRSAIQYSKGALFFDALRAHLGDDVFWSGLKFYTQTYAGKTVTSRDLQFVFEQSSDQDLSEIFEAWVY